MESEKIKGKLLECSSAGVYNENPDSSKHHFKLNFKTELENGDKVICSFAIFYNNSKALEYCASILHSMKPDKSQGSFESLFVQGSNINLRKYFKALPIEANIDIKLYEDRNGETKKFYNLSGLSYEVPKAESIKEIPVTFNFETGKMEQSVKKGDVPF